MSEIRKDIITGDSVIISPERAKRPHDFKAADNNRSFDKYNEKCPFCSGNESMTPPEVLGYRTNLEDITGWSVRVVPNLFSPLLPDAKFEQIENDFYEKVTSAGRAEVLVECPEHNMTLGEHSHDQMVRILYAIKERYAELKKDERIQYINVFKNFGPIAGASKEHAHWQTWAIPVLPNKVERELNGAKSYYDTKHSCPYCDIIKVELDLKQRVVVEEDNFVVLCPYAPKYAFEMWILPKRHFSSFDLCTVGEMESLARVLKQAVSSLEKKLNYPPYNILLHTIPFRIGEKEYYHWYFQICPKLSIEAGFEMNSGIIVTSTPPEIAAESLRE